MDNKNIYEDLSASVNELSELLGESKDVKELSESVEELTTLQGGNQDSANNNKLNGIERAHIKDDKEANALTMQIKIDGTLLKGQTAKQAFETFDHMKHPKKKFLSNFIEITQKNPPQDNEKIGEYFVRLADNDLIEIDDNVDIFINLFHK
ncbi:MAG: hypothetical protein U9Q12_02315 [Patescibacteria group bacterium]|nr:hypothetical protein [Patescibacteria group bacterium]